MASVPAGWRRDWILFTDGWVKDGDIHTRNSQTVDPLPYHGMTAYPDLPSHEPPRSPAYGEYLESYQTRYVDDREFREWLRRAPGQREATDPDG